MALSKDSIFRLEHAVTDANIGDEIAARIGVNTAPVDAASAQAILDILDKKDNDAIKERLFVALAGDGSQGNEISKKLIAMIDVLEKFVALKSLPPGDPGIPAATTALNNAKAAMGSEHMSAKTKESLIIALTDKDAADEFSAKYDLMIDTMQSLV